MKAVKELLSTIRHLYRRYASSFIRDCFLSVHASDHERFNYSDWSREDEFFHNAQLGDE